MQSSEPWRPGNGRLEQAAPVAPAIGGSYSAHRRTPSREPSVSADVWVPVLQGTAVGIAAGCLSILVTAIGGWPWYSPLVVTVAVAPVAVAGFIFGHRALLWTIEQIDSESNEPEPPPAAPAIEISATYRDDNDRPAARRFTLPHDVTDQTFYDFLTGILSGGKSLSRTDWTGKGQPLSRAQHQQLINELARLRAVTLVDPAKPTMGYELTRLGKSLFQGWVESLGTRQNEWD